MLARPLWFGIGLVLLNSTPSPTAETAAALRLWEQGQQAMLAGQIDRAIACYQQSLDLDPSLARNHLSLAAAYVARGEDERAEPCLGRYVVAQPDHLVARAHYAELLLRLHRPQDARTQFERFVADVQEREELARQHLVHCHSRLMEIAEGQEDEYGEHLHRGIGLYLLACRNADLTEAPQAAAAAGEAPARGKLSTEGLLCRAAAELTLARLRRPDEARPCWYLYEVWSHLSQQQPARRWLRAAEAAAPLSYLSPAERRRLRLALQQHLLETHHK